MELQSTNWDFQFDWPDQVQLGDLTAGASYGQLINPDNIHPPCHTIDCPPRASQEESSLGSMSILTSVFDIPDAGFLGSLRGQSLSNNGTTNTYSTNTTQFTKDKEDVLQLLQASQSRVSFQRQTSVLRKIFPSMLLSRDVEEIGNQIGLRRTEILTWFDVEKTRRDTWSYPSKPFDLPPSRQAPVELRRSLPFLDQVCLLRESFDQNQWPSNEEFLQLGRETCVDAIDVMLWFDAERDIQVRCLQSIPAHVPGVSMVEAAHEPVHQGVSVDGLLPVSNRPTFDLPETGEYILSNSMELPLMALESRPTKEPTSCLGKRTLNSSKPAIDGQFPCLSCTKRFRTMAYWRNHQTKVHFSEKIYECWENKMDGSPCLYGPVLRADNLRTHLVKEHGHRRDRGLITKVNNHARIAQNLYHDKCGFASCYIDLPDFKTSMDHIAEHLSSGCTLSEWTHICQKEHGKPPHSKQNGCQNTIQNNGHDDDDDDDDGDDNQGDNDDGHGDNQQSHTFGNGSRRSHGFSRDRNQSTQNTARKNQVQESHEDNEDVTDLSDHYNNSDSPQLMTPSADGMAIDIAIQSIEATHARGNIEAFPVPKHFNLDNYFRRIRFLGRGNLGFVENVVSVASNKIYARKTIRRCQISFEDLADIESLNEELEVLKSLRHSHLVRLIDVYTSGDFIYIFMSPVADGNLASFFHSTQSGRLSQNPTKQKYLLLEWMSCLQSVVGYLHSQNVVHEDLKPENILVKENTIFLTDIKDLKQFTRQESVEVARPHPRSMYCAPETVVYGIIDAKSNTFSLGCVFTEMLTLYFDRILSDFTDFRACETRDLPYHSNLERTNTWIDLLTANLPLPDSSFDYGSLSAAVHDMLIESSSERPTTREIRLGVKELLQEMVIGRSPDGPSVPDIPLEACKLPQKMVTENSSEQPRVTQIHPSTGKSSRDVIIHTMSKGSRALKWDWDSHFPKMVELYHRGQTIPQIHKAVQCDTFRPCLRAVYDKFNAMSYPTGHTRPMLISESNLPRAAICVPIKDETHVAAIPGLSTDADSLVSQKFKNAGNNGYNESLLLQGQVADEHLASRTALDSLRHLAKENINDGTFSTSPGLVGSANGLHQSMEPAVGLSKMGPYYQHKRRDTLNKMKEERIIQTLQEAGFLNSGGRTKPQRSKEALDPMTDFQAFLKMSNRLDLRDGQPGGGAAGFASHARPIRKIRSFFDKESTTSKARTKQNSPFADNDSGYYSYSSRRTTSTLHLRDSLTSHTESLSEFQGLYRVACYTLHETKRPDQHREAQLCHYCGCSSVHILASCANLLKLEEFEAELKSKDPHDVQVLDAAGNSALHYAAITGASYAHLRALMHAGAPLYARNTANQNFLHCLRPCDADAKSCSLDCFKLGLIKLLELIEPKIAFGQQDNDGRTILHVLASHITEPELRERIFDIFTGNGFPPIVLNRFGKSAKDIRPSTYQHGQTMFARDTFNIIGTSPPDLELEMSEWQHNVHKQMNAYNILIEAHHNPHCVDSNTKDTVLHALSRVSVLSRGANRKNDIIQDLRQFVAKGVNLNWHNRDGHHPLAAFICNQDFRGSETGATMAKYIDILLWKGGKHGERNNINVNMMSRNGATALYEAAIRAQSEPVRSLIEADANVNARLNNDTRGLSVLQATLAARDKAVLANDQVRMHMFKEVISYLEHAGAVANPTSLQERGRPT